MTVELITMLAGATTASKNVVDLLKAAKLKLKGNREAESELSVIESAVSDLHTSLLTSQTRALSLQTENGQLREKIRAYEERAAEKDKYESKVIKGHSVVVLKGHDGPPYWCHSCFMRGDFSQLARQPAPWQEVKGSYACPKCDAPHHI